MSEAIASLLKRLDDPTAMSSADPADMLGAIERLPEQCEEALEIATGATAPQVTPTSVTILGMGGSAIGGDLVRGILESESPVPIVVNRDYDLPAFVGQGSLVVASSYSGNTEETLTACLAAAERRAHVVAITTGGELARLAAERGWPLVRIPAGLSPRAALGYSFVPLLLLCDRLGLAGRSGGGLSAAVQEAIEVLKNQRRLLGRAAPGAENPAKRLAALFYGRLPLIYGSHGWKAVAAYRWKCQVNENAKAPAYWNAFPELNHNETTGWQAPPEVMGKIQVVCLRDRSDPPKIHRRLEVTAALMRPSVAGIETVWAEGEHPVARLLSLIYPGDFASAYLAILYGLDPTPVPGIDHLKRALAAPG